MKKEYHILCALFVTLLLLSCGDKKQGDDKSYYEVKIAVDETFRPIIEEELKVFNAKFTEAVPMPSYMPETDAINLMLQDSIRMILSTRPLSEQETQAIFDTYRLKVRYQPVAYDAVALIINPQNADSLINVSELRDIMLGKVSKWEQLPDAKMKGDIEVVFDNANSSTVRYVRDSICGGQELKGKLKGGKNNKDVIEYVSQTPNAMGIIGVDWLRNQSDSTNLSFDQRVRVMSVSRSAQKELGNSFQPVQYYIATGEYPLTRCVYMITTDPRTRALGLNFYYFVSDQNGQLIITKSSQLLPYMPVQIKTVDVTG